MSIRLLLPIIALSAAMPAMAGQVAPRKAAKAFTLNGLDAPAPAPATPEEPPVAVDAAPDAAAPIVRGAFTLDTPVQDLIADAGAKAVLDKDLPGMSDDENLPKFKALSLRQLQPQTGGQLTDAMLAKVASDLDILAGGTGRLAAAAPAPKPATGQAKRNRDQSR